MAKHLFSSMKFKTKLLKRLFVFEIILTLWLGTVSADKGYAEWQQFEQDSAFHGQDDIFAFKSSYDFHPSNLLDDIPASNVESSCIAYLHVYSELAANFTKCAIVNARPLRFCEKCVQEYVQAQSVFDFLMKVQTT